MGRDFHHGKMPQVIAAWVREGAGVHETDMGGPGFDSRRLHHVVGDGFPEGCYVARLNDAGQAHYGGQRIYVSTALAGLHVALKAHGDRVRVWFHRLLLGHYDPSRGRRVTVLPLDEAEVSPPAGLQIATGGVTLSATEPPSATDREPPWHTEASEGVTLSPVPPEAPSGQQGVSPTRNEPDPEIDSSTRR